ncbi:hypothetical protein LWI29_031930 [Acer saccharum]|uniref:Uncharacterized protein n=1 Tax=Acer saccharum TaxID=4024 RepID=A0AA39W5S0_ACESA|nr:hypothetical protein LWI29_031930 [Acer saccharum]
MNLEPNNRLRGHVGVINAMEGNFLTGDKSVEVTLTQGSQALNAEVLKEKEGGISTHSENQMIVDRVLILGPRDGQAQTEVKIQTHPEYKSPVDQVGALDPTSNSSTTSLTLEPNSNDKLNHLKVHKSIKWKRAARGVIDGGRGNSELGESSKLGKRSSTVEEEEVRPVFKKVKSSSNPSSDSRIGNMQEVIAGGLIETVTAPQADEMSSDVQPGVVTSSEVRIIIIHIDNVTSAAAVALSSACKNS